MSDDLARRVRNLRETLEAGDIDQAAYERALDRLRDTYGAARLDALLGQAPDVRQMPGGVAVNISTDSSSISGAPVSVVGHAGSVTFPPPSDPALACEERALLAYLQRIELPKVELLGKTIAAKSLQQQKRNCDEKREGQRRMASRKDVSPPGL
jgi:hypothetical protein